MIRILRKKTIVLLESGENRILYFDDVQERGYGLYVVEDDGKFSIMDDYGRILRFWCYHPHAPQSKKLLSVMWFDEIGMFNDFGLARVRIGKKYGVVRFDGCIVSFLVFRELEEFKDGYAITGVQSANENERMLHGFIRYDGFVIPAEYEEVMNFSGEYAPVMLKDKWGFVDSSGKLVVEPRFDRVIQNSDGVAVVEYDGRIGWFDIAANRLNN